MKKSNGHIKVSTIIFLIIVIVSMFLLYRVFDLNYFNGFQKAVAMDDKTSFKTDSKEKYSDKYTYLIENFEQNDAAFFKEVELEGTTVKRASLHNLSFIEDLFIILM